MIETVPELTPGQCSPLSLKEFVAENIQREHIHSDDRNE